MGILFDSSPSEPTTLEEVVFQSIGAASICWETPQDAGEFDATRAKEIGEEVVAWIQARYLYVGERVPAKDDGVIHTWDANGLGCGCGERHG